MTTPSADKGARFERSIVEYFRTEFGAHVDRGRSGATDDRGDVYGVHGWTFELKAYANVAAGINIGLKDLAVEQANTQTPWGAAVIKRPRIATPERQLFIMELGAAVPLIKKAVGV